MTNKHFGRTLCAVFFVGIAIYVDCDAGIYGGAVVSSDGVGFMYGAPTGLMPQDITPDKVRFEHIKSLLDEFEQFVLDGEVSTARIACATPYLMSFVTDKRFSKRIYDEYGKPLFETYGEKVPEVVYLYYFSGGSLEKLEQLYGRVTDEKVKYAIETCFLDAGKPLKSDGPVIGESTRKNGGLSITLSCKENRANELLRETSPFGKEDDSLPQPAPEEYEVTVEFENTAHDAVSFRIPMWALRMRCENFIIKRGDDVPIPRWGKPSAEQDVVLYPGNRLIAKCELKLENIVGLHGHSRGSSLHANSVFNYCFRSNYVALNSFCISTDVMRPVSFDLQFEQPFVLGRKGKEQRDGIARSNVLHFEYEPKISKDHILLMDDKREKLWQEVDTEVTRIRQVKGAVPNGTIAPAVKY